MLGTSSSLPGTSPLWREPVPLWREPVLTFFAWFPAAAGCSGAHPAERDGADPAGAAGAAASRGVQRRGEGGRARALRLVRACPRVCL